MKRRPRANRCCAGADNSGLPGLRSARKGWPVIETAIFTSADGNSTRWRLLGIADEAAGPRRYVQLKFDVAGGQILGYLVLRGSGEEVPLDDVRFDAMSLWFRLPSTLPGGVAALDKRFARAPRLALTLVGDREFRGYHVDESDVRLDPARELRLVREDDEVVSL